jgi:uridylate kinase
MKCEDAKLIKKASFRDVIDKDIKVMDHTAITLAKEGNLTLKVVNLYKPGAILKSIETNEE